ncbi:unnamed protein product [Auanema sp. JU1783]|nr:unnamed protein product [Auanema sp. JU1783]
MGTEVVLREPCFQAAPSNFDRPFKILVQNQVFLIDSEYMKKMSPVFSVMCYGKDFENGRELSREIVDEKCSDIDVFLRAVNDPSVINATNFSVILRLSNKYMVQPVIDSCQTYIKRQNLDVLQPDEVMTLLISAYEFHCSREVMVKLIRRMAAENNTVFTRLKISRFLPAQIYGAVMSTSMNLSQLREYEAMNGHNLKMERLRIRWKPAVCQKCSVVCDQASTCDECKVTFCKQHVQEIACPSDYGIKMLAQLKDNVVDLEWKD